MVLASMPHETVSLFSILGLTRTFILTPTINEAYMMAKNANAGDFSQKGVTFINSTPSVSPNIPVASTSATLTADDSTIFKQPLVVECDICAAFVRVHGSGHFMCPSCHAEFNVDPDGTVIF